MVKFQTKPLARLKKNEKILIHDSDVKKSQFVVRKRKTTKTKKND